MRIAKLQLDLLGYDCLIEADRIARLMVLVAFEDESIIVIQNPITINAEGHCGIMVPPLDAFHGMIPIRIKTQLYARNRLRCIPCQY